MQHQGDVTMGRSIEEPLFFINSPRNPSQTQTALGYRLVDGRNRVGKRGLTIALLSLALGCIFLSPGTLQAATIAAASCSRTDVNAAISNASDGDTVLVPAGTCTWDQRITIT